jgi:uncharacterized protein (DUF427 family)
MTATLKRGMNATPTAAVEQTVRAEQGAKRVRAYLGGQLVADTVRPLLVWEVPNYPTYYFPAADVRAELLHADGERAHSTARGDGERYTVKAADREARGAAVHYGADAAEALRDTIRLRWDAMEAWFEEDEEVFTHARDPYTRIDILASSRHVRVEVEGVTLAESSSPRLLFETGLAVRYYLPRPHVRMDRMQLGEKVTHCPYKGRAESWSARVGKHLREDLAWSYPAPLPESQRIAGLIAFYNEKVELYVDGALQERRGRRP